MLQSHNTARADPDKVRKLLTRAKVHLHFCVERFKVQLDNGRPFPHEHPDTTTSWRDAHIQALLNQQGVEVGGGGGWRLMPTTPRVKRELMEESGRQRPRNVSKLWGSDVRAGEERVQ